MPTINCVKYDNKIYCYDRQKHKVLIYSIRVVNPSECPDCVLSAFIGEEKKAVPLELSEEEMTKLIDMVNNAK